MSKREALLKALTETLGSPSPTRSSGAWKGYSGPLGGAQPLAPGNRDDAQPFPYRTQTAVMVWKHARELIPKHPELDEGGIIKRAIEESGANPLDLSPEDWRLLEMAVEWRKNGIKGITLPRIGGAPGGPYNSWWQGHELAKRGAP
jgi:hypothetical protein